MYRWFNPLWLSHHSVFFMEYVFYELCFIPLALGVPLGSLWPSSGVPLGSPWATLSILLKIGRPLPRNVVKFTKLYSENSFSVFAPLSRLSYGSGVMKCCWDPPFHMRRGSGWREFHKLPQIKRGTNCGNQIWYQTLYQAWYHIWDCIWFNICFHLTWGVSLGIEQHWS